MTMTHTNTSALLRELREWHPDHNDLVSGFAGLASCVKHNQTGLSEKCIKSVVDLLDQAAMEVENDKAMQQQDEQLWLDKVGREA